MLLSFPTPTIGMSWACVIQKVSEADSEDILPVATDGYFYEQIMCSPDPSDVP